MLIKQAGGRAGLQASTERRWRWLVAWGLDGIGTTPLYFVCHPFKADNANGVFFSADRNETVRFDVSGHFMNGRSVENTAFI